MIVRKSKSIADADVPLPKLRCFVAMPYNREDVDSLYRKHISRAIRDAGMIPLSVDKLVHNERIDEKIRKLIKTVDVAIADLTYARPSVYWEAGYAERQVPVIYVCREDHFRPTISDEHGNLQVHFDLRNANIIRWSNGDENKFQKALLDRLLYVTREIRANRLADARKQAERGDFSKKTQYERCTLISNAVIPIMKSLEYNFIGSALTSKLSSDSVFQRWSPVFGRIEYRVFFKKNGQILTMIILLPCIEKLNMRGVRDTYDFIQLSSNLYYLATWAGLPDAIRKIPRQQVRSIRRILVSPILENATPSRIETVFDTWHRSHPYLHYYETYLPIRNAYRDNHDLKPMSSSLELLVLPAIKSLSDFSEIMEESLNAVEQNTAPIISLSKVKKLRSFP